MGGDGDKRVHGHPRAGFWAVPEWQGTFRMEQGAVTLAVGRWVPSSPAKGWGHLVTPVAPWPPPCVPAGPCHPPPWQWGAWVQP